MLQRRAAGQSIAGIEEQHVLAARRPASNSFSKPGCSKPRQSAVSKATRKASAAACSCGEPLARPQASKAATVARSALILAHGLLIIRCAAKATAAIAAIAQPMAPASGPPLDAPSAASVAVLGASLTAPV